jgi:membrane protein
LAESSTPAAPDTHPPHWRPRALLPILKETINDWLEDKAMRLSAALAFYTILSLAPLLVITLKIVGAILKNKESARDQMLDQISDLMGWHVAQAVKPMIETAGRPGGGHLAAVISSAVLLFSATGVFAELQDSMNTIWGVKPVPNRGLWDFLRHRLLSLAMVLGTGFLLLVSMFVTTVSDALAEYVAGNSKAVALVLDIVVSFGVSSVLFAAIFKFLPDVKLSWRHVWLGAVITAACFIVGKYALALYFRFASPTSAFGAAGSLAAVMLWVYYSSFILFFGAEFTKVWSIHHLGHRVVPHEHAVKVTEEDRAQQGIPSGKRLNQALDNQDRTPG